MAFASVLFIALFVFWIWAIFDSIQTPRDQCRNLPKLAWVLLIVIIGAIAAFAWLLFGRPRSATGRVRATDAPAPARRRRPAAPVEEPRATARPMISDRRSAELDAQLERWEREQREHGTTPHVDES